MTDWDHANIYVRRVVSVAGAVFLPWYLWSLAYYPEPLLWTLACSVSLVCVVAAARWPRSVLYWLAPGIMLFNHLHFWLPWPYVKLAFICPAAVCLAAALRSLRRHTREPLHINVWFTVWFLCIASSACMGVLRRWCAQEPAAWHELARHLRLLPFLDEWNPYVPLRYVWVWSLALATYVALLPLLRRVRDVRIVVWSIVVSSLPAALFGISSYATRSFMVSHYHMERRISATFSSPAVLADMLTVACMLCGYLLYTTRRRVLRVVLAGIVACNMLAILYSGCRINMVVVGVSGLLAALAAAGLRRTWAQRRWWLVLALTLCVAATAAAAWRYAPPRLRMHLRTVPAIERTRLMVERWRTTNAPLWKRLRALLPGRISHWEAAARMLRQHPLWGIGAGLFESSYARFRTRDDLFIYARAHNIFLRIAAEGGVVTWLAFIAVLVTLAHTLHICRGNARETDAAWLQLRRTLSVTAAALLITSFFSDIWLENVESVMMLAVLMALGTAVCHALTPVPEETDEVVWPSELSWWQRTQAAVHERLMLLTWGWVGLFGIRRLALFLCTAAMCLLGLRRAFYDGRKTILRGEAAHGFISATAFVKPGEWFAFGRSAMRSVIVPGTVLRVTLQPLNERMAREAPRVSVWINNVLMGHLLLYPGAPGTLYCDLSALRDDVAVIRFVAERTFSPWRLAWFKDPFSYGGVSSSLEWLHHDPLMAFTRLDGLWNAHWTAHAPTYYALGHTNLDATVRVPFHVLDPL